MLVVVERGEELLKSTFVYGFVNYVLVVDKSAMEMKFYSILQRLRQFLRNKSAFLTGLGFYIWHGTIRSRMRQELLTKRTGFHTSKNLWVKKSFIHYFIIKSVIFENSLKQNPPLIRIKKLGSELILLHDAHWTVIASGGNRDQWRILNNY